MEGSLLAEPVAIPQDALINTLLPAQARKGGESVQVLDLRRCSSLADVDISNVCQWFADLWCALQVLSCSDIGIIDEPKDAVKAQRIERKTLSAGLVAPCASFSSCHQ